MHRGIRIRIIDLLNAFYYGTESAVQYGGDISSYFPGKSGMKQWCAIAPSHFNTCLTWVVDQSHCGTFVSNGSVTNNAFTDDAVHLAESVEILVMTRRGKAFGT